MNAQFSGGIKYFMYTLPKEAVGYPHKPHSITIKTLSLNYHEDATYEISHIMFLAHKNPQLIW